MRHVGVYDTLYLEFPTPALGFASYCYLSLPLSYNSWIIVHIRLITDSDLANVGPVLTVWIDQLHACEGLSLPSSFQFSPQFLSPNTVRQVRDMLVSSSCCSLGCVPQLHSTMWDWQYRVLLYLWRRSYLDCSPCKRYFGYAITGFTHHMDHLQDLASCNLVANLVAPCRPFDTLEESK